MTKERLFLERLKTADKFNILPLIELIITKQLFSLSKNLNYNKNKLYHFIKELDKHVA